MSGRLQPFVILTTGRTGSTLLVSLLNSHPEIICHSEPYNPNGVFMTGDLPKMRGLGQIRKFFPVVFARFLLNRYGDAPIKGFKILSHQSPQVHAMVAKSPKIKKILLRRDNGLAAYSSNMIAHATQQWHVREGVETKQTRVVFDADSFDRYTLHAAEHLDSLRRTMKATSQRWLELEYRDLLSADAHRSILEFLGADESIPLRSGMTRRSPPVLKDRFENWDDVVAHLTNIGREDWLIEK